MHLTPATQYAMDGNLAARQRLWAYQRDGVNLVEWVLGLAGWEGVGPVLDAGCGNGRYLDALQARGVEVVGCDLSFGMLASAGNHRLVNADAARLPFSDASFAVVLAAHMLYHVLDVAETASELRRVLAPGGIAFVVTNGAGHLRSVRDLVEAAAAGTDPGWRMLDPATRAFSLETGSQLLAGAFPSSRVARFDGAGQVSIDDATVVADYLSSVADIYGPEVRQPWADVVQVVRQQVQQIVDSEGHFVTSGDVGAIVCA
jgi:SAM-dependent methyltransferase